MSWEKGKKKPEDSVKNDETQKDLKASRGRDPDDGRRPPVLKEKPSTKAWRDPDEGNRPPVGIRKDSDDERDGEHPAVQDQADR